MKRVKALLLAVICVFAFTACADTALTNLKDGTYRAEYKNFDAYGWKDFVEVTVVDGAISELVYDAVSMEDGSLKSEDEAYKQQMEPIVGTYPAKYSKDLINQFMESNTIGAVDVVAGATQATGSFKTLLTSIAPSLQNGDTELVLVDDFVAEK